FIGSAFSQSSDIPVPEQAMFVVPKLSQGPDFQVFSLAVSQGQGNSLVKLLNDYSYYQRALVLPSTSMRMNGSVIHEEILALKKREHPDKDGLLNRPTLIIGGKLSSSDNSPLVDFVQLRLPDVRWENQQDAVSEFIVKAKVVGGSEELSMQTFTHTPVPIWVHDRLPFGFSSLLPQGLPDEKTSHIVDFPIRSYQLMFAMELNKAIRNGGTIQFSVYEVTYDYREAYDPYDDEVYLDVDTKQGNQLYEINYTFEDDPHNAADRNLKAIIGNGINALNRGEGFYAGPIQN
ncbi:hypothetical protein, partial [Methylophaga muralis]